MDAGLCSVQAIWELVIVGELVIVCCGVEGGSWGVGGRGEIVCIRAVAATDQQLQSMPSYPPHHPPPPPPKQPPTSTPSTPPTPPLITHLVQDLSPVDVAHPRHHRLIHQHQTNRLLALLDLRRAGGACQGSRRVLGFKGVTFELFSSGTNNWVADAAVTATVNVATQQAGCQGPTFAHSSSGSASSLRGSGPSLAR